MTNRRFLVRWVLLALITVFLAIFGGVAVGEEPTTTTTSVGTPTGTSASGDPLLYEETTPPTDPVAPTSTWTGSDGKLQAAPYTQNTTRGTWTWVWTAVYLLAWVWVTRRRQVEVPVYETHTWTETPIIRYDTVTHSEFIGYETVQVGTKTVTVYDHTDYWTESVYDHTDYWTESVYDHTEYWTEMVLVGYHTVWTQEIEYYEEVTTRVQVGTQWCTREVIDHYEWQWVQVSEDEWQEQYVPVYVTEWYEEPVYEWQTTYEPVYTWVSHQEPLYEPQERSRDVYVTVQRSQPVYVNVTRSRDVYRTETVPIYEDRAVYNTWTETVPVYGDPVTHTEQVQVGTQLVWESYQVQEQQEVFDHWTGSWSFSYAAGMTPQELHDQLYSIKEQWWARRLDLDYGALPALETEASRLRSLGAYVSDDEMTAQNAKYEPKYSLNVELYNTKEAWWQARVEFKTDVMAQQEAKASDLRNQGAWVTVAVMDEQNARWEPIYEQAKAEKAAADAAAATQLSEQLFNAKVAWYTAGTNGTDQSAAQKDIDSLVAQGAVLTAAQQDALVPYINNYNAAVAARQAAADEAARQAQLSEDLFNAKKDWYVAGTNGTDQSSAQTRINNLVAQGAVLTPTQLQDLAPFEKAYNDAVAARQADMDRLNAELYAATEAWWQAQVAGQDTTTSDADIHRLIEQGAALTTAQSDALYEQYNPQVTYRKALDGMLTGIETTHQAQPEALQQVQAAAAGGVSAADQAAIRSQPALEQKRSGILSWIKSTFIGLFSMGTASAAEPPAGAVAAKTDMKTAGFPMPVISSLADAKKLLTDWNYWWGLFNDDEVIAQSNAAAAQSVADSVLDEVRQSEYAAVAAAYDDAMTANKGIHEAQVAWWKALGDGNKAEMDRQAATAASLRNTYDLAHKDYPEAIMRDGDFTYDVKQLSVTVKGELPAKYEEVYSDYLLTGSLEDKAKLDVWAPWVPEAVDANLSDDELISKAFPNAQEQPILQHIFFREGSAGKFNGIWGNVPYVPEGEVEPISDRQLNYGVISFAFPAGGAGPLSAVFEHDIEKVAFRALAGKYLQPFSGGTVNPNLVSSLNNPADTAIPAMSVEELANGFINCFSATAGPQASQDWIYKCVMEYQVKQCYNQPLDSGVPQLRDVDCGEVRQEWQSLMAAFLNRSASKIHQLDDVKARYWKNGLSWAKKFGLQTVRGVGFMFDQAVQSGSISGKMESLLIQQSYQNADEIHKLQMLRDTLEPGSTYNRRTEVIESTILTDALFDFTLYPD